ncbi:hypothetical protein EBB79_17960 [Parasedimentitalea marina]|uniref:Uncharacterized protein n=1 Tax=Parasedimentitalea marina TaxID=2483033 RepID=A0A3T0N6B4_9RHOB|nr:hypothetical protein EBB79_17960 [Parasedimentitalea marina]
MADIGQSKFNFNDPEKEPIPTRLPKAAIGYSPMTVKKNPVTFIQTPDPAERLAGLTAPEVGAIARAQPARPAQRKKIMT